MIEAILLVNCNSTTSTVFERVVDIISALHTHNLELQIPFF